MAESSGLTITVKDGPICPKCGGVEVLAGGPVRPYKVDVGRGWESHCVDCDHWFLDEEDENAD